VKSTATNPFYKLLANLPGHVQQQAREAYVFRAETGVSLNTLNTIANNKARRIGPEVLGGLLPYFDGDPNDFIGVVSSGDPRKI